MDTSHPVYALSHDLVERIAVHRPAMATMWGMRQYDGVWDDISPEGIDAWRQMLVQARADVGALPDGTDPWNTLAIDVAEDLLTQEIDELDSGQPYRSLGHVASPFQAFHLTFSHMEKETTEGREAIRARQRGLPEALDGYRRALQHGLDLGERASVRQVRSCIEQGRNVVAQRLVDVLDEQHADDAVHAYDDLTRWLEHHYLPRAAPADGVGEERYLPAARRFLRDDLDLDETYVWGWEEIRRLHERMEALLDRVAPGRSLGEAVAAWRTDPATTAASAEEFLDRIRSWQDGAFRLLDGIVPTPPIARQLRIERAPLGLPPGAWYMMPSEKGDRPGTVQYSLSEGPVPLFDQQSTAVHEGFPGHHLQLALQTTLRDRLSRLHRLAFHCTGFAEGWALYAERLVDEQGGYDDEVQELGYLVNQMARACRVVLDIGLHTGRAVPDHTGLPETTRGGADTGVSAGAPWTFDRAVAFMTEIGGLRREVSTSEITRYLGWPGQAISYSVGLKRLLEVRTACLAGGGTLPDLHQRVLGSGTVGLGRLARTVLATP